ncbi:MAG: hypothetical protein GX347_00495 [Epulopiscium sp.]|nr:hypothetical protein [Candidatus Epulonipiscium sp.]
MKNMQESNNSIKNKKKKKIKSVHQSKQNSRIQNLEKNKSRAKIDHTSLSHQQVDKKESLPKLNTMVSKKDLKRAFLLQELLFKKPLALRKER